MGTETNLNTFSKYKKEALALHELNPDFSSGDIARVICETYGVEKKDSNSRKVRKWLASLNKVYNTMGNLNMVSNETDNVTLTDINNYPSDSGVAPGGFTAISSNNKLMNIGEYCEHYGLDVNKIRSYKLISHSGIPFYNIVFHEEESAAIIDIEAHLEDIIKTYIKPIVVDKKYKEDLTSDVFDRLVYTDVHIGMDVNGKDGDPMYDGVWDKNEVLRRLDKMISHVCKYQKSDTLYIDDLGDFMDGLNGQTTRKGHELPQNMNDKEAFDLALYFKVSLVDALMDVYFNITCNNITNDNHSGVFSYFVSSAVKQILEQRYPGDVTVNSLKRFVNHYSVGNQTFVISHGKDMGENKFGFKPKLDAVQLEKIDQYCKESKLYNGNFIEFSKGDSHQAIYDDTTSNDFSYYNYPAFSPPSNWVKTNFKNSKSGFNFFNINKNENIKISIPYWF